MAAAAPTSAGTVDVAALPFFRRDDASRVVTVQPLSGGLQNTNYHVTTVSGEVSMLKHLTTSIVNDRRRVNPIRSKRFAREQNSRWG